ncbi:hypothetical protein FA15DRAFT_664864 [Coprinopsis marcescibilis]|uniref:DUF1640-domain-containing protein n=1 Tax=Coprinopsis marcescibilis TaxID=230819 RepID=A0A5C3L8H9_COPMA|nr:hypothetical protein FA15DRAFT_664864 [Coprinopsis marcescibilis]
MGDPPTAKEIALTHPKDPGLQSAPTSPPATGPSPSPGNGLDPSPKTGLLSSQAGSIHSPSYTSPPFNTHSFFNALERTFPENTARSLMRATRALLVDRIGKVRREGLNVKDLDNQAYLFRAAVRELRAEITMNTKKESATIVSATSALRREADRLDVKMKEDITTLKHEIQMELDTRKNEVNTDIKQMDIEIEELLNKAVIRVSDLRTDVEEAKWDIMRKAVLTLAGFIMVIIISMEMKADREPKSIPKSSVNTEAHIPPAEGFEKFDHMT